MLPPNVTDVKGFLLRNCNKVQSTFAQAAKPLVRGKGLSAPGGRWSEKPCQWGKEVEKRTRRWPTMPNWEFAAYTQTETKKYRPLVDTSRRYGYNTYRVRPKRSAALSIKCYSQEGKWPPCCSRAALFFSYGNRYRFYIAQPSDKKCKQFLHKPHLLSDGVLTAAYPVYYTCRYYNAYVEICLYWENSSLRLTPKGGTGIISVG